MSNFEIFKTISIGGITKDQLIKQLIDAGIQFNEYAKILFEHHAFSPINKSEKVKLVKVTLSDLGMDNPCSFQEVVNRASTLGLRICPLYCAAFLRLEYLEQPEGSYLTVASDKPESDENYPNGFYVRNFNKTLWLRGYRATDFCEWPIDNEFLFLK
jgi:hypothetical protein